jgi:hypothetical protein
MSDSKQLVRYTIDPFGSYIADHRNYITPEQYNDSVSSLKKKKQWPIDPSCNIELMDSRSVYERNAMLKARDK